jgi:acetolactate synthase-1/3 small subunit
VSGPEEKIEAFIDVCQPYGIKNVARTGTIAMPRHGTIGIPAARSSNTRPEQ